MRVRTGHVSGRGVALVIGAVLPVVVTVLALLRVTGFRRQPVAGAEQGLGPTGHFLLAVAAVLLAVSLAGLLADRLGQPRVISEILAGLALGPTLLGRLSPHAMAWLFPAGVRPMLSGLSQLGLVLFMFTVGRELSAIRPRGAARQPLLVSQASFALPFAAGAAVAVPLATRYAGPSASAIGFVLFVGCALSVTALPVLARILQDLDIVASRQGALSLFAAAVGDACVWTVLAVTLATAHGGGAGTVCLHVVLAAVLAAVCLGPLRRLLARLPLLAADRRPDPVTAAVLVACAVTACAALTEELGLDQIIGAMLVGLAWPSGPGWAGQVAERLSGIARTLLLPFFFFGFGLTVDLGSLPLSGPVGVALAALLVAAVGTKLAGPALAARLTGMAARPALAVGVLVNTRGLTELVLLQVGFQAGIIDRTMLVVLTVVALVATVMTRPLLGLLGPAAIEPLPAPPGALADGAAGEPVRTGAASASD